MPLPRAIRVFTALFLLLPALQAQESAGLPPEWETRKLLDDLVETARRLDPVLSQLDPEKWKANGAPDTYGVQLQSARQALKHIQETAGRFAKDSARVSLALETFFRLEAADNSLRSIVEGVRKYQNPAIAELIAGIANENAGNRDKLRQYLKDLAAARDAEFAIIDSEAQRCRASLSQQPPAKPKPSAPAKEND